MQSFLVENRFSHQTFITLCYKSKGSPPNLASNIKQIYENQLTSILLEIIRKQNIF